MIWVVGVGVALWACLGTLGREVLEIQLRLLDVSILRAHPRGEMPTSPLAVSLVMRAFTFLIGAPTSGVLFLVNRWRGTEREYLYGSTIASLKMTHQIDSARGYDWCLNCALNTAWLWWTLSEWDAFRKRRSG